MGIGRWVVVAVVAVMFSAFAVANRGAVDVSLWPLPLAIELPRYALGLGGIALGFVAGLVVAWIAGRPWRRRAREGRRRVLALEAELAQTRRSAAMRSPQPNASAVTSLIHPAA